MDSIAAFVQRIPAWFWIALVAHGVIMGMVAYLILLERKIASWVQDRLGPNRVGPGGLLQPMADGLKFFFKEDYRAKGADGKLFTIAPAIMIMVAILSIAVIPWGGEHQRTQRFDLTDQVNPQASVPVAQAAATAGTAVNAQAMKTAQDMVPMNGVYQSAEIMTDAAAPAKVYAAVTYRYWFQIARLNIGVLFIVAALSLSVYGVVVGGWASNNKYSFLGGLRAAAQMISYEIPLGLCILCIVLMYGNLELNVIVDRQAHYWAGWIPAWNIFTQPLVFLMFLVCIHAEANRAPFDLAEAEQELVGGYHTEYSSMRFALFFLSEYAGMITTSAVCVALFFGGWHVPWLDKIWPALSGNLDPNHPSLTTSLGVCLIRSVVFLVKVLGIIFVFMWVRWTLPRFRFDQLMMTAWRAMIPMSLGLLLMTALVIYFTGPGEARYVQHGVVGGGMALTLFIANWVVLGIVMAVSVLIPPPPETNRRLRVVGSRFQNTPLPAGR